jgi:hypothetical protein
MKTSKNSRTTTPEGTQPKPELTFPDSNTGSKSARISYQNWVAKYRPIKNPFNEASPYNGCLFENYGEILQRIGFQNSRIIWSLIDFGRKTRIVQGLQLVNSLGHFITEVKAPANRHFSIKAD